MEKSKQKIFVIDNSGLFLCVAVGLTRFFETVRFYNRWECAYPYIGPKKIGDGFDGIEKVDSIDDYEDDTDIFFICDAYFAPLAKRLRRDGRKVWGSGDLDYVERDRDLFIEMLEKAGLPIPETESIESLDKCIEYLQDKKDMWVKISEYRGMTETFHWKSKLFTQNFIDKVKVRFGPFADDKKLICQVQKPIDTKLEYGVDMPMVKGQVAPVVSFGFEGKDKSYFTKLESSDKLPDGLKNVNTEFEKITKMYNYTGCFSNEVRVPKTGDDLFTDITPRAGYPSICSMMYISSNFGKVIEKGVNGEVVELKPRFKYAVEIIVSSDYKSWNPISYPAKYKENIFPCYCTMYNGVMSRVPDEQIYGTIYDHKGNALCSVVAGSDSLEDAIKQATEICESIEGMDLCYDMGLMESSKEIVSNLKKQTGYIY